MQKARNGSARFAWYPEVAGTGIEDNLEVLRRGSESNFGVILGVHKVAEGHTMTTLNLLLSPVEIISVLLRGVKTTSTSASTKKGSLGLPILLGQI
jgi:hypothetical protein